MAITKYKVIKKNLEAVINYAKNGEKTDRGILVSGLNCLPQKAYEEMMLTKKQFHKEGGRLGYHIIQSFQEDEVSPEECNQLGLKLAEELWGDKYQVLVCTHINKANVHNHIILNSVSFIDGRKYHNSNLEIFLLRDTNDCICLENDLSIVETAKANKEDDISLSRIDNYTRSNGKIKIIKDNLDEAIAKSLDFDELKANLAEKGYYIKERGDDISLTTPYFKRNIRLFRTFGRDYTYENILYRLEYTDYEMKNDVVYKIKVYDKIEIDKKLLDTSKFYRLYVHYLYVLGKLPPKIHYQERTKEYYKEIDKFDRLNSELKMISENNIESVEIVENLIKSYSGEKSNLSVQKEECMKLYKRCDKNDEKLILEKNIDNLKSKIKSLNDKIQTCRKIIRNFEKIEPQKALFQKQIEKNLEKFKEDMEEIQQERDERCR